jgi:hypothetical protein
MTRNRHIAAALCAATLGLAGTFSSQVGARALDDDVTLKGCLVKGEGDGAGYLLTNAVGMPGWQRSDNSKIEPSAVGTTGGVESVFYWLDDDDDLDKNVGHQVEITGELEGELKDGQIELDRKDAWTEMTVKADGRTMKANVPNASMYPAPREDHDRKARVLVRRVDVSKVTMLEASCGTPAR